MKPLLFFLLPLISTAAIPKQIAAVIDMARQAPGEFCADALIRVAAGGGLEKATRVQLLDEAFRRAGDAQQPLKREASIVKVAGNAAFWQHAYAQNLDRLSLRLRAVDAMVSLDRAKARSLFLEIPPLEIPRVGCDEYLVYDVSLFYEVLGRLARQSFTWKEIANGEPVAMLARFAGDLRAPAQVVPAARMLTQSGLADADFQSLVTDVAGSLGRIAADDRSFSATASAAGQQILALAEEARRRGVSSQALVEGYRAYLVNNLAGPRCADDDLMETGASAPAGSQPVSEAARTAAGFFNDKLATPPVLPLRADEIAPSKVEGAAGGLRSCQSPECKQLAADYRKLILDGNGTTLSNSEKDSAEWRSRLEGFLNEMAAWKDATAGGDAEQFRDKCALYSALINMIPFPADRERVSLAWLDYLDGNPVETEDRMEWFLPVNSLIGRTSLDRADGAKLVGAFQRSRDPVIALYLELERVAPRTPDQILPLM